MNTKVTPVQLTMASSDERRVQKPRETFEGRHTEELVIGLSGPVGSGSKTVIAQLTDVLREAGYKRVIELHPIPRTDG